VRALLWMHISRSSFGPKAGPKPTVIINKIKGIGGLIGGYLYRFFYISVPLSVPLLLLNLGLQSVVTLHSGEFI